jgi:peroxiredoxin Q/BCP
MPIESGIPALTLNCKMKPERCDVYPTSGKPVVLYFYPKDDTLGCTPEACNFRDD